MEIRLHYILSILDLLLIKETGRDGREEASLASQLDSDNFRNLEVEHSAQLQCSHVNYIHWATSRHLMK